MSVVEERAAEDEPLHYGFGHIALEEADCSVFLQLAHRSKERMPGHALYMSRNHYFAGGIGVIKGKVGHVEQQTDDVDQRHGRVTQQERVFQV